MTQADPYADRRRLTFEQAEGVEPLPVQLATKEISRELRAYLWAVLNQSIMKSEELWKDMLREHWVFRRHNMVDEFDSTTLYYHVQDLKNGITSGNYLAVFGFLQFLLRSKRCPAGLAEQIDWALKEGRAAYRVLDGNTVVPISSEAERTTLERTFADLAATEFHGARNHLRAAGSELTVGQYASSIRESIHAVESVARTLAPSGKLSEALAKLEQSAAIHGGLKSGFLSIYGYTSDEKGIRHPLLDDQQVAKVDEADALFVIGACAAFVSYMIHKARLAGLLK